MGNVTSPETKHATALHGDVVGYSKLMADNEIETANTLQTFRRIIDQLVSAHEGELVNFVGDAFLAIIPTESGAISAAMAIQRRLADENESLPAGRKVRFRLGANAGDLSVVAGSWFGDAINIAARLQALADPGGVNVSRWTLDAAGDIDVKIESLGDQRLKNIPDAVPVFRLVDEAFDADRTKPWKRRIPAPVVRPSLAVSPFVNYGADEDSHFSDGLMMALLISLARVPGVDVVSETSTLGYRYHTFSAEQLGHELGVKYVLEGATQRSGSRVRVMAQLIDVDAKKMTWADRFEASFDDVFKAQDDIVDAIVAALDVEVIGGDARRMFRSGLSSDAVEIVYRGLQYVANGSPADLLRAADAFEEVVRRNPDSATGYTMGAMAHNWMAMFGMTDEPDRHFAEAEELAEKALERGDVSGISQGVLAHVKLQQHDWDGALAAVREATSLRPSCDVTYGIAASVMRYLGHWEEAVDHADRAVRLSPLFSSWYLGVKADAELIGEEYETAADLAEGIVADDDDNIEALLTLAAAQAALGRDRHAAAAIEHIRRAKRDLTAADLAKLPYRDEQTLTRFITQLRAAGLD